MQVVQERFHSNTMVYYWLVSRIFKLFLIRFVLCMFVNNYLQKVFPCVDWCVHRAGRFHTVTLLSVEHGVLSKLYWCISRCGVDGHSQHCCGTVQGQGQLCACGQGTGVRHSSVGLTLPLLLPPLLVLLGLGSISPGSGTPPGCVQPSPLGLLQKELLLGALLQISLSLPGNLTLLFYHVVTVLVFTAYLCYSHLHVHEHSTVFPSSCGCFMSYNWNLDFGISWMFMWADFWVLNSILALLA